MPSYNPSNPWNLVFLYCFNMCFYWGMHVCACGGQRVTLVVILRRAIHSFETGPFVDLELTNWIGWIVGPKGLLSPPL